MQDCPDMTRYAIDPRIRDESHYVRRGPAEQGLEKLFSVNFDNEDCKFLQNVDIKAERLHVFHRSFVFEKDGTGLQPNYGLIKMLVFKRIS